MKRKRSSETLVLTHSVRLTSTFPLLQPPPNLSIASKTGTLNTKSVTASQLATNSPILPHKMNGQYYNVTAARGEPPKLPPRGVPRPNNGTGGGGGGQQPPPPPPPKQPPAVPPKRSSLTRSDLTLFDSVQVRYFARYFANISPKTAELSTYTELGQTESQNLTDLSRHRIGQTPFRGVTYTISGFSSEEAEAAAALPGPVRQSLCRRQPPLPDGRTLCLGGIFTPSVALVLCPGGTKPDWAGRSRRPLRRPQPPPWRRTAEGGNSPWAEKAVSRKSWIRSCRKVTK